VRIALVAVGKVKQPGLRQSLDDYLGRIRRYASVEELELKDAPARQLCERFERAIPARARTIALEVEGRMFDSPAFAQVLGDAELSGVHTLAFLIGGADGLPPEVSARANQRVSLSRLTLPHRLARLVLVEQLYRGFTIVRGEPYAH